MFVSSYSTYIDTTVTKKVSQERREADKKPSESFDAKLLKTLPQELPQQKKLPLSYISDYKTLHNKQQLQEQSSSQKSTTLKFIKLGSMSSAKAAYSDNSTMFPLIRKPKPSLDQTPQLSKNLPKEAQEKQKILLKTEMLNTYIANDNYFRITAA